jgi:hypothetical protein
VLASKATHFGIDIAPFNAPLLHDRVSLQEDHVFVAVLDPSPQLLLDECLLGHGTPTATLAFRPNLRDLDSDGDLDGILVFHVADLNLPRVHTVALLTLECTDSDGHTLRDSERVIVDP